MTPGSHRPSAKEVLLTAGSTVVGEFGERGRELGLDGALPVLAGRRRATSGDE
jgi:hypothetical protein